MSSKLVSVIIPCYNCEKTVEKTIKSVASGIIGSSDIDLEIICINDCSKDQTIQILKNQEHIFSDHPRIKVVIIDLEKNVGVAQARNFGLEKVTGDYVTFIDSDDILEKGAYTRIIPNFDKGVDIVSFAHVRFGNWSRPDLYWKIKDQEPLSQIWNLQESTPKNWVVIWDKVFKASLIKNNGMKFRTADHGEDIMFCIEAAFYADTCFSMTDVLLYHYKHKGSLAGVKRTKKMAEVEMNSYQSLLNDLTEKSKTNGRKFNKGRILRHLEWLKEEIQIAK